MIESRSPSRPAAARAVGLAAAVAVAGCLAGCGGSGTRPAADGTVRLAMREYRITPQKVHASQGSLTFDVTNVGRLTHSLLIETTGGHHEAVSDPIAPGQSTSLVATLAPGRYLITSNIQSDKALGLYGTLDVG